MKSNTIKKIALSGLLAAVITVITYFPMPVPIAHGYVNLGDCFVLLAGIILGPAYGFLAAGVGSALADVFAGFAAYAPATFIIKGIMALAVYYLSGRRKSSGHSFRIVLSAVIAELIMMGGYFLFELVLYGAGAFASLAGNGFQGFCCALGGSILMLAVSKNSVLAEKLGIR